MLLSVLIIVLMAAIVFFQAVHGLFSSLIMALCTLVCTLLAFTYYEPLAALAGLHETQPAYGEAIMLVALLVIPLFVLRFLVDNYLPGNVVPSMWVDRVGGAAFGVVTALLLVGTLVVAMQMLPFDATILGWTPYDAELEEADGLIIDAPAFTRGVVRALSAGSLGAKPFADVHRNLRLELWAVRNRDEGARTDATPDAAKLVSVLDVTDVPLPGEETVSEARRKTFGTAVPAYPGVELAGSRVILVRVELTEGRKERRVTDTDNMWRLRGTHFRLVTDDSEGYYPVGYMVYTGQWQILTAPIGDLQISREYSSDTNPLTADLLYRVPATDGKTPDLSHLAFRRSVRLAADDLRLATTQADLPDDLAALKSREVRGEVAVKASGPPSVFRPVRAVVTGDAPVAVTVPTSEMPQEGSGAVSLRSADASATLGLAEFEIRRGVLQGSVPRLGALHGNTTRYRPIDRFYLAPGQRIVQLEGRALSDFSMARLLRPEVFVQARVHLLDGPPIPMVGAWVKWTENGVEHAYVYYNADRLADPNLDLEAYPEDEAIEAFKLYREHMSAVSEVGLLFLVPEDATVLRFNVAAGDSLACENPMTVDVSVRR